MDPFNGMTGPDRLRAIIDHADEETVKDYEKALTTEDREEISETLVEAIQRVDVLTEELKQIKKEKTAVIDEEKLKVKTSARTLRQGFHQQTGKVYIVRNYEEGTAYEYDAAGDLIMERKLKPKERQTTIRQINPGTGTNG